MTSPIEHRWVDKSEWGPGPWQDEPDKVQWRAEASGLPCLARRGPMGNWCGYVGVPPGHPLHRVDWSSEDLPALDAHGGLTYSAACSGDEERGICHVPQAGEPDPVWWFGFDCCHSFDFAPGMEARWRSAHGDHLRIPGQVYRDLDYVREECAKLAAQLGAFGGRPGS